MQDNTELIKKNLDNKYDIDDYLTIHNKLGDEKSKKILFNRVMYDNTKKIKYSLGFIENMYDASSFKSREDRKMYEYIKFLQTNDNYNKKICFFGIGYDKTNDETIMWEFLTLIGQSEDGLDIDNIYNDEFGFSIDLFIKRKEVSNINDFYDSDINNNKIYIIIESKYNYIEEYLIEKGISNNNIFKFDNEIIFLEIDNT